MSSIGISDVWNELVQLVTQRIEDMKDLNPRLRWTEGSSTNKLFPFRGFITFSRSGDPTIEDLVFSLDCRMSDGNVECSSDLAGGDGLVYADGPRLELSDLAGSRGLEALLAANRDFLNAYGAVFDQVLISE